jgi:hypothetical protein
VWVLLQVALALVLMELDIFDHIVTALAWYANIGIAWIAAMVSDIVVNGRLLKLRPEETEFRRAHLFNINPVGFGAMLIAAALSMTGYYGVFGAELASLSPFLSFAAALVLPPVLALATKGRWYIARTSDLPADATELPCSVCGGSYDVADMATCPHHGGTICSLCCSIEGNCRDRCKPSAWVPGRVAVVLGMPAMPTADERAPAPVAPMVTRPETA